MNKLGQYNNDERGNYSFNFHTEDGKHVNLSFRAEPDYDLDIVFSEFKNFLIASVMMLKVRLVSCFMKKMNGKMVQWNEHSLNQKMKFMQ
jgi:hypothetical protein